MINVRTRFAIELVLLLVTCLLLAMLAGCNNIAPRSTPSLLAEQATYNAVAPEYGVYVNNDPVLTTDQKARRARTVETWRLRLEREAAAVSTTQPVPSP